MSRCKELKGTSKPKETLLDVLKKQVESLSIVLYYKCSIVMKLKVLRKC